MKTIDFFKYKIQLIQQNLNPQKLKLVDTYLAEIPRLSMEDRLNALYFLATYSHHFSEADLYTVARFELSNIAADSEAWMKIISMLQTSKLQSETLHLQLICRYILSNTPYILDHCQMHPHSYQWIHHMILNENIDNLDTGDMFTHKIINTYQHLENDFSNLTAMSGWILFYIDHFNEMTCEKIIHSIHRALQLSQQFLNQSYFSLNLYPKELTEVLLKNNFVYKLSTDKYAFDKSFIQKYPAAFYNEDISNLYLNQLDLKFEDSYIIASLKSELNNADFHQYFKPLFAAESHLQLNSDITAQFLKKVLSKPALTFELDVFIEKLRSLSEHKLRFLDRALGIQTL